MESKKFIEVLNWKKYQDRMPDKGVTWFKVHCSLANCEAFQLLDYKSQMTLIGLWMYAAESGHNVMKADKRYLYRYCRLLKEEPDLRPLLNAVDDYGNPHPFIRYCEEPNGTEKSALDRDCDSDQKTSSGIGRKSGQSSGRGRSKKAQSNQSENTEDPLYSTALKIAAYHGYISARKLQLKLRIGNKRANDIIFAMRHNNILGGFVAGRGWEYLTAIEKSKIEKNRVEQSREEQNIETLSGFGKEKEREKTRVTQNEQNQSRKEQNPSRAETEQNTITGTPKQSSIEPENPNESEAGAVSKHHVPKQPRSAYRGGDTQRIGDIITGRFPDHWKDPDAEQFGWEIVRELGMPVDPNNMVIRSEWGAFASWWYSLKQLVPATIQENIREIAIKKARHIRLRAKKAQRPGAVWFHIMEGELNCRGIALPNSRASPVSK